MFKLGDISQYDTHLDIDAVQFLTKSWALKRSLAIKIILQKYSTMLWKSKTRVPVFICSAPQ